MPKVIAQLSLGPLLVVLNELPTPDILGKGRGWYEHVYSVSAQLRSFFRRSLAYPGARMIECALI